MFLTILESTVPPELAPIAGQASAKLQPILQTHTGFIDKTDFTSVDDPTSDLSIVRFEDEAAALRWRNDPAHLRIQKAGREKLFSKYRVRAGYQLLSDATDANNERTAVLLEEPNTAANSLKLEDLPAHLEQDIADFATYKSDDAFVHVVGLKSRNAATLLSDLESIRSRCSVSSLDVQRDYSGTDRKEALS